MPRILALALVLRIVSTACCSNRIAVPRPLPPQRPGTSSSWRSAYSRLTSSAASAIMLTIAIMTATMATNGPPVGSSGVLAGSRISRAYECACG